MLELFNDKHLYDVWLVSPSGTKKRFIMRAPLRTIRQMYKLDEPTIQRILRETDGCCVWVDGMKLEVSWGSELWQTVGEYA